MTWDNDIQGWQWLPVDQDTDWSYYKCLQQIVNAIQERWQAAVNHTPIDWSCAPGWDCQSARAGEGGNYNQEYSWYDLQWEIDTLVYYHKWVVIPEGEEDNIQCFEGEDTIPVYTIQTFSEALTGQDAVGARESAWTRKYPREIDSIEDTGAAGQIARHKTTAAIYIYSGGWQLHEDQTTQPDLIVAYGRAKPGDYLGIWIINELYKALNLLLWRKIMFNWALEDGESNYLRHSDYGFTPSAANTALQSAWPLSYPSWHRYSGAPYSIYELEEMVPGTWRARYTRQSSRISMTPYLTGKNKEIAVYLQVEAVGDLGYQSNDNIDTANLGEWDCVLTDTTDQASGIMPDMVIGEITAVSDWSTVERTTAGQRGWQVTDSIAIARYNVTGGFVYVPEGGGPSD